jgi:hypothetical protein
MKDRSFLLATLVFWMLNLPIAKAEIDRLINTDWQEVPNTYSISQDVQFSGSIFVDINSFQVTDRNIVFDAIGVDYSYNRLEINCQTAKIRALRMGVFLEGSDRNESRIDFSLGKDSWRKIEKPDEISIKEFVCSRLTNSDRK